MTGERTRPVLEAVHIRPYSKGGIHELPNGILLRSDLHILFDDGYLTIDPEDRRVVASKRMRDEFDNGEEYYRLHGKQVRLPSDPRAFPSKENLRYHSTEIFR